MFSRLMRDSEGQDLVEYSFLLGAIALAGAAAIVAMGNTIDGIWNIINGRIAAAID